MKVFAMAKDWKYGRLKKKAGLARRLVLYVLPFVLFLSAGPAKAQTADTACDPEYMDSLEAKAWLEAQREIAQNQNLILKPDSVFDYTCFLGMVNQLAAIPPFPDIGLFSEVGCCGGPGLGPTSLNEALFRAVGITVNNYISNAGAGSGMFEGWYLANRVGNVRFDSRPFQAGFAEGYEYNCTEMQGVWTLAKCMNFFDQPDHDAFFDFQWYTKFDPRLELEPFGPWSPSNMCTGIPFSGLVGEAINVAFNDMGNRYTLPAENPWPSDLTPYLEDPVFTFFDLTLPVGLAPGCAGPLPTGIMVNRVNIPAYPDGICPNAGCYLTQDGGACTQ
ncbi:MAG: hypothetical protein HY370_10175 [Proteobacteria bacterium]|nr:hypothetical protein [Pseudomonadota bacterium]